MKLADYLALKDLSIAAAAREAGYPHETFRKWVNGTRRPRKAEDFEKIQAWSEGAVTAADFFASQAA